MPVRGPRAARIAALALVLLGATGCARLFGTYGIAPSGLAVEEDRLRTMLARGRADSALARFDRGTARPDDDVLRALYEGMVAYHAGDWARAADVLDRAGMLADDRMTKSVSRSALSLLTSDLVLPYEPGPTERLMIPYYAALARIRAADIEGAAVEARRIGLLLQQYDADDRVDRPLRAALRYFSAAVFAAAGERNDADVAYRNAVALGSSLPHPMPADADSGAVVVVLEQGYVAHRVEQGLMVMLLPEEIGAIADGSGEDRAAAASLVAGRVLAYAADAALQVDRGRAGRTLYVPAPEYTPQKRKRRRTTCTERVVADSAGTAGASTVRDCREIEEEVEELPYLLKVAWPVLRTDTRAAPPAMLRLNGGTDAAAFGPRADVSRSVVQDFERERALIVARTIARGTLKLAVTRGAGHRAEERSEVAGRIVGLLGNVGSVLLERADTRSWHLLPGSVTLARVALPPGEHDIEVEAGTALRIDGVEVRAGGITLVPVRAW